MRLLAFCISTLITCGCAGSDGAGTVRFDSRADPCLDWLTERDAEASGQPAVFLPVSDDTGCFDGKIMPAQEGGGTEELEAWASVPPKGPEGKLLVIRSRGGEAGTALGIAEQLQSHDASVLAPGVCASSCANYLYAGIADRHVTGGALILFHGGFADQTRAMLVGELNSLIEENPQIAASISADRDRILRDFDEKRIRQDALLRRAGANPAIIHGIEALDLAGISSQHCGGGSSHSRDFVFFDDEQMLDLGIAPVTGRPAMDSATVNATIANLTTEQDRFVACRAPADFL
jgi:hypothetical protein